jgi:hypothetical protein
MALILFLFASFGLSPLHRKIALILAISPTAAANTQLISGVFIQPCNYEQYWGTLVVAALISLIVKNLRLHATVLCLCVAIFTLQSYQVFRDNLAVMDTVPYLRKTIEVLKSDSARVVVPDLHAAAYLDLVWHQQPLSAFSITRTYSQLSDKFVQQYVCDKIFVLRHFSSPERFQGIIQALDESYKTRHMNYVRATLNRSDLSTQDRDISALDSNCLRSPASPLEILDE